MRTLTAGMIAASVLIGGCTSSGSSGGTDVSAPRPAEFNNYERFDCSIQSATKLHCVNSKRTLNLDFKNTHAIPKFRRDMGGNSSGVCLIAVQGRNGDIKCQPKK